jgi:hypothetical protein
MSVNDVLAVKEQKQVVKDLITKACEKIHKWLLSKTTKKVKTVPSLKKRQGPLQKYNALFHFLLRHNAKNADEVAQKYSDTVSRIYGNHFRHYLEQIGKTCLEIADKTDILAEPEHTTWSFFSTKILSMKKKTPVYSLTQRCVTKANRILTTFLGSPLSATSTNLSRFLPHRLRPHRVPKKEKTSISIRSSTFSEVCIGSSLNLSTPNTLSARTFLRSITRKRFSRVLYSFCQLI